MRLGDHVWPVASHCDRPIPLRLVLLDTNDSSDLLYLQTVLHVSFVIALFFTIVIVRRYQPLNRNFSFKSSAYFSELKPLIMPLLSRCKVKQFKHG